MINTNNTTESLLRTELIAGKASQASAKPQRPTDTDRLSSTSQDLLASALAEDPEIRPEVVARAQKLVVDANYPPKEIIRQLSELLIVSPDLSEQS